jgi:hypothetical protein
MKSSAGIASHGHVPPVVISSVVTSLYSKSWQFIRIFGYVLPVVLSVIVIFCRITAKIPGSGAGLVLFANDQKSRKFPLVNAPPPVLAFRPVGFEETVVTVSLALKLPLVIVTLF